MVEERLSVRIQVVRSDGRDGDYAVRVPIEGFDAEALAKAVQDAYSRLVRAMVTHALEQVP